MENPNADLVLSLLVMFIVKHFIVDFLLQRKYQYSNKHIYGHPGGLLHAFLHGITTFAILIFLIDDLPLYYILVLAFIDFVFHYHIDWGKTNLNIKCKLNPQTDSFWILLGLDQTLHMLTYVLIIILATI